MWFDSDATQGYNLNVCTSTDVWTPLFSDISNNVGIGTSSPIGAFVVVNGNVGIGTWSPIGQLEVRGGSGATRIWTGAGTDTECDRGR
jgi:UDP-3-O-[3-hydroxymyristoyl] glucosamine N-acyltransferase